MKKIYLTILVIVLTINFSYAQWTNVSGTGNYYLNSGNAGIGTTSPAYNLEIRGNDSPVAVINSSLGGGSTSGETSIFFGDAGSAVKMLTASKRTINTRALEIWTEYGYNAPHKAADFYHDYLNFYTADVNRLTIINNGNVGIGTTSPDYKLTVNGTIHSQEVKVDMNILPDYVFNPAYDLPSLKAVKAYVDQYHHLPEVPSAQQVAKEGLNLGEMNAMLLKKVEELTLYLIEKDKQLAGQNERIADQQNINHAAGLQLQSQQEQINQLKQQLSTLIKIQTLNQSDVK